MAAWNAGKPPEERKARQPTVSHTLRLPLGEGRGPPHASTIGCGVLTRQTHSQLQARKHHHPPSPPHPAAPPPPPHSERYSLQRATFLSRSLTRCEGERLVILISTSERLCVCVCVSDAGRVSACLMRHLIEK